MKNPSASGRASYQGRDRLHPLKLIVTPEERHTIETKAKAAGLSVASYLRSAALGHQLRSEIDREAVRELVKVAADQGRLGGLLKLWLVDQPGRGASEIDVRRLLEKTNDLQGTMAEIVSRI
jgi:hypothetical protein